MAGERNLGRGRTTKKVVSYSGSRNTQGVRYGKTGRAGAPASRGTRGRGSRGTQTVRTSSQALPESLQSSGTPKSWKTKTTRMFGKTVKTSSPTGSPGGRIKLSRARSATANLGRAANFTAPRGSRGGAKWHGK